MSLGSITHLVEIWTVSWTALLALGYLAEFTPWPGLQVLRSFGVAKGMLLSSMAVVFGFTLAGATTAAGTLSTWAILFSSLNWLFHYFKSIE